jgi:hypothetical protein
MIFNIPIEDLEERYSAQWNKWYPKEYEKLGIKYKTVMGESLKQSIEVGSFLDIYNTNYFKSTQLASIIKMIMEGEITENDTLLFHDGWYPGIEALQYIRDGGGPTFKIAAIFHAGTYDPWDFLTRHKMASWGSSLENCWFNFLDYIFVATEYHRQLILSSRNVASSKIHVTGLPIYFDEYPSFPMEKEDIVVFPHRLNIEKQPKLFDRMPAMVKGDWKFLKTKECTQTKSEYFQLLSKSKIAVSCALQETWGIAQQEAVIYSCFPVVPNRLSYVELYPDLFRYNNIEEAVKLIKQFQNPTSFEIEQLEILRSFLMNRGATAIKNMMEVLSW